MRNRRFTIFALVVVLAVVASVFAGSAVMAWTQTATADLDEASFVGPFCQDDLDCGGGSECFMGRCKFIPPKTK